MTGLRLSDCGDLLTVDEYAAWARKEVKTVYNQLHKGTALVRPFALKPTPVWRRTDLEAALLRNDLVAEQRKQRVRSRMGLVKAS